MSQSERDALLLKILDQVPFDGWSETALANADPAGASWRSLFPHGVRDAIRHFADWADRAGEARLEGVELGEFRSRDQIAMQVRARLEALAPWREAVRKEAGWITSRSPDLGPKLLWRTVDRMWARAGDTATDFNHYSKRALLAGVIATTTLCWLGDKSEGNQATWDFLERRIGNVMQIGKLTGQAKKLNSNRLMEAAASFAGKIRYRSS